MHDASTVALKTGYNTRFEELNGYKRGSKADPHMYFSLYGGRHSGYTHSVVVDKMSIFPTDTNNVSVVSNKRYVLCNKEL